MNNQDKASNIFVEAMSIKDPGHLKSALANMYSIVRGNTALYSALSTVECLAFLNDLMKARDQSMADKAASLLAGVMCRHPNKFTPEHVKICAEYNGSESGKLDVLANLLKHDGWRSDLYKKYEMRVQGGLSSSSVPVAYKALMCVWLTSFLKGHPVPVSVITPLNDILKSCRTEKVIRIALMAIENLLKSKQMCEEMAEQETVGLVQALEYEKWRDDELIDLIKHCIQQLQAEVKMLTNFERFEREVNSGKLKWGFIHSERFWLENVKQCESNNFRVIEHLLCLAQSSRDAETLAVACHDLGEFARLHPFGKQVANTRGAKDRMLELMSNGNRDVAREALLCVQKLMLQNSSVMSVA